MISRRWYRRWLYAHFPPYRWWKNSSLYHRLTLWRWKRSIRKLEKQIGSKFIPAMGWAIFAMQEWNRQIDASREKNPEDPQITRGTEASTHG